MTIKNEESFLTKAINKKIGRRSFIKWSAAIGATTTMSGLIAQSGIKVAGAAGSQKGFTANGMGISAWKGTRCLMCHSVCYLQCGVTSAPKDGQPAGILRKIEGQGGQLKTGATTPFTGGVPANGGVWDMKEDANYPPVGAGVVPYAQHNRGRICAKGNNGMEHVYDPDRIKYPLYRTGDRGTNKFKKVSWAWALKYMANVLRELAGYTTFYDLLAADSDDTLYALGTTGKGFGPITSARGVDNRHRFIDYVGRTESDKGGSQFAGAYGTPNLIEHTSLCELSRHQAGRMTWGHHWSIPDLKSHKSVTIKAPNGAGTIKDYGLTAANDCDFMIEMGGNPVEAKIPSASYSVHWGDSRRRNHKASGGNPTGRIVVIDVRQSNSAAFADEWIPIKSGADGALALAMFRVIGELRDPSGAAGGAANFDALQAELAAGHLGSAGHAAARQYHGLFEGEDAAVPAGYSLEGYVRGLDVGRNFPTDVGAASASLKDVLTAVAGITGIDTGTIVYLARALAGYDCNGSWDNATETWTNAGSPVRYKNCVLDGYRGPAKHSNGSYNYRAIRALQIVAANKYADDWAVGVGRGGYDAPGAFVSDGRGTTVTDGLPSYGYGGVGYNPWTYGTVGGNTVVSKVPSTNKAVSRRIDQWDYENNQERWRFVRGYKWNDQNLIPAVRYFLGLHPYKTDGSSIPAGYGGPTYTGYSQAGSDPYKPEAMLLWKNAPAYARPNVELDVEAFTSKSGSAYRLKHLWSIDCFMGDGTRFSDLILPDTTYLERYDLANDGDFMYAMRNSQIARQPVVEDRTTASVDDPTKYLPRHLFDARSIRAITYELARLIQPDKDDTVIKGTSKWTVAGGDPADETQASVNGALYRQYSWVAGDTATRSAASDYVNDGEYATEDYIMDQAAGVAASNGTFTTGKKWMIGDYASGLVGMGVAQYPNTHPNYWSDGGWTKEQGTVTDGTAWRSSVAAQGAGKLQVYNHIVEDVVDIDGNTFSGTPIYQPIAQSLSGSFPLRLTTYKLNVHTQSRTASNPRQQEIIGSNWAMINPVDAEPLDIKSGDAVRVTSAQGSVELEAKVTPKAQAGHVHISHSAGHDSSSFGGDGKGGSDGYLVDGQPNRADTWTAPFAPTTGAVDSYRRNALPSAPRSEAADATADKIRGTHCNRVITRWVDGVGQSTDPLGVSVAWMDTAVKIEKA